MKSWLTQDSFGFDSLSIVDRPKPPPGPREVAGVTGWHALVDAPLVRGVQ